VVEGSVSTFFDVHCHALTLSHPNFLSFMETLRARRTEIIYSQIRSPDFLARALFRNGGETLRNMLAVMENSPGLIFEIMEDDLAGGYAKDGDPPPLIRDGALRMLGRSFDAIAVCPLIMDFDNRGQVLSDAYYYRPPVASIEAQIRDVLVGIRDYRRSRPGGMLRIHPFLGVNTRNHSLESLSLFLVRHMGAWRPGPERARAVFAAMSGYSSNEGGDAGVPGGDGLFAGIKLYPPLGFDPWPEPGEEREKVELLYGFCERRGIPITTHCDDRGFRVVGIEEAFLYSAPSRYRGALERFPELRIDFAHFGRQYTTNLRRQTSTAWFEGIVELIDAYPNVYADVSFNGVDEEYYAALAAALAALPAATREKVSSRLLFGSDFVVNLIKIRAYADYFRLFDASPLDPELKLKACAENPARFLFEGRSPEPLEGPLGS
jgi:hypothetical protein